MHMQYNSTKLTEIDTAMAGDMHKSLQSAYNIFEWIYGVIGNYVDIAAHCLYCRIHFSSANYSNWLYKYLPKSEFHVLYTQA